MGTRNLVFLIHGIGREGDDWAGAPLAELQKAADISGAFRTVPLEEQIEFVPIVYNDIFDLVLDRWQQLATDLQSPGFVLPDPMETLDGFVREISSDGNAAAEFAGDAILYVGFRLVRNAVLLRVIGKIVEGITKAYSSAGPRKPKVGVIAHSLGTTVAHDALQLLATLPWGGSDQAIAAMKADVDLLKKAGPQGERIAEGILNPVGGNPAAPASFTFKSLFMVSNTSPLLHTTRLNPYESCVYPSYIDFPPTSGCCDFFYDADNKFDVVGLALKGIGRAFQTLNDNWIRHGIQNHPKAAVDLNLGHLHWANAHDLAHYLKHPLVYSHLFLRMASTYGEEQHNEALARPFPNFPAGPISPATTDVWDRLFRAFAAKMNRWELQ